MDAQGQSDSGIPEWARELYARAAVQEYIMGVLLRVFLDQLPTEDQDDFIDELTDKANVGISGVQDAAAIEARTRELLGELGERLRAEFWRQE